MEMTARGCRKLAMTEVLIAVMLCQSIIQSYSFYWGGGVGAGGRLQVDELVHQQQGAGQAGQAGFRAATVTARVAS